MGHFWIYRVLKLNMLLFNQETRVKKTLMTEANRGNCFKAMAMTSCKCSHAVQPLVIYVLRMHFSSHNSLVGSRRVNTQQCFTPAQYLGLELVLYSSVAVSNIRQRSLNNVHQSIFTNNFKPIVGQYSCNIFGWACTSVVCTPLQHVLYSLQPSVSSVVLLCNSVVLLCGVCGQHSLAVTQQLRALLA